jgi:DNA-binding response OmpR family regulator
VAHKNLIFVAEDNVADATLLRIALHESQVDCDLEVFNDGATALEAVAQAETAFELRPDLFVLDLNLPHVNGMTILARIRRSPAFQGVPVIVWTSSDAPADRIESVKSGADRFISKPHNLETFLRLGELAKGLIVAGRAA